MKNVTNIIFVKKNHNIKINIELFWDFSLKSPILEKMNLIHNFAPHCINKILQLAIYDGVAHNCRCDLIFISSLVVFFRVSGLVFSVQSCIFNVVSTCILLFALTGTPPTPTTYNN